MFKRSIKWSICKCLGKYIRIYLCARSTDNNLRVRKALSHSNLNLEKNFKSCILYILAKCIFVNKIHTQ